ncbi:hypothetical protein IC608_17565 [Devosia sp. PTR5]|uniref:Flagellar basal-body/hook protein C-terminal domain-containing protein n=1 Tax=Devosia oryzisoli TaxID=2774138 RepID=A0A927G040_9HYPH|nr:flagellar basal body rod C-terminal domain-containing protein [Devosia oryzisoli]MBD8067281.1 hypothetical protein [Devosia oryzisoli]
MSLSSLAIGATGMRLATDRFETSAARIARLGTGQGNVDVSAEMVNVLEAKADFTASAKIVRVASDMSESLLDILA